jgi:hypothetical protein
MAVIIKNSYIHIFCFCKKHHTGRVTLSAPIGAAGTTKSWWLPQDAGVASLQFFRGTCAPPQFRYHRCCGVGIKQTCILTGQVFTAIQNSRAFIYHYTFCKIAGKYCVCGDKAL